jgi:hypothetical protein
MDSDMFGDKNFAKLHQAYNLVAIPEFVKQAVVISDQKLDKTASDNFADPATRKYPLTDKSNTWLSRMYFELFDKEAMDPGRAAVVAKKIEEAASFWQLPVMEKKAEASIKPKHIVKINTKGYPPVVTELFIMNVGDMEKAAEDVRDSRGVIPYEARRDYARGLLNAPANLLDELDTDTKVYLDKVAGFGMTTKQRVVGAVLDRVCLLTDRPDYSKRLTEIGTAIPETPTPAFLQKIASVLDLVDRDCDFCKLYSDTFKSPEEALFSVTEKEAMEALDEMVPLTNGNVVHKTAILKNPKIVDTFFDNYFGERPYTDMESRLDIIKTLPAEDATALQKLTGLS